MAVRTANFLSGFLQVVDPKEIFPGKYRYTAKAQYRKIRNKYSQKRNCAATVSISGLVIDVLFYFYLAAILE